MLRAAGLVRVAAVTLLLLFWVGDIGNASAQSGQPVAFEWSTEAGVFAANALMGGVSAGLAAVVRGDPPVPAFARGFGGGALVYAGKRIAADPRPGTGLLGRQVASVGGSIIGNAVAGRRSLDRVAFGVGPMRAYVGRDVPGVAWRLDVPAAGVLAWGLVTGAELDVAQSVSTGAIVLRRQGEFALPGTIFYSPSASPERKGYVLAHEQVHILQYDQSFLSWGDPFEVWLARRFPSLRATLEYLEFNAPVLATAALVSVFVWEEHGEQPWEKEAIYLGRTR